MASVAGYKSLNAPSKGARERVEIQYDFSVDGGAVGVLDLGVALEKIVIERCYYLCESTHTSGGLATVEVGIKAGDTDALIAATDVADLAADAIIDEDAAGRNLVVASGAIIAMEIKVAALTAGKGKLMLEYSQF